MKKALRPMSAMTLAILAATAASVSDAYALPPQGTETWKPAGTAMLRDDLLPQYHYVDDFFEFPVEIEESEQVPGRYRLVNAYANYPKHFVEFPSDVKNYTIIDCSDPAHVYISKGVGAYYVGQDQCISFWSKADDLYFRLYEDWDQVQKHADCVGTLTDGIVTFPKGQVMIGAYALSYTESDYHGENPEEAPDMLFLLGNMHGKFRLRLPGAPEPEVKVTLSGYADSSREIEYKVDFGADTEYVDIAVIEGDYVGGYDRQIASGEVASTRLTASGTFKTPYLGDQRYTLVAVPYYKSHAHNATIYTKEVEFAPTTWKPLCTAKYTEGFLHSNELSANPSTGWSLEGGTYDVEVEYDAATYRRLRIREPYAGYVNTCITTYDFTRNHYIEIDAADLDCVRILPTVNGIGFNLEYLGTINVWSRADRYLTNGQYTRDQIVANGWNGTLRDDAITFGKKSLYINLSDKAPDNWYLANYDGTFRLQLPAGTMERYEKTMEENAVNTITAPTYGPDRWLTIDGRPLPSEPTAPGLYLHIENGRTHKILK